MWLKPSTPWLKDWSSECGRLQMHTAASSCRLQWYRQAMHHSNIASTVMCYFAGSFCPTKVLTLTLAGLLYEKLDSFWNTCNTASTCSLRPLVSVNRLLSRAGVHLRFRWHLEMGVSEKSNMWACVGSQPRTVLESAGVYVGQISHFPRNLALNIL